MARYACVRACACTCVYTRSNVSSDRSSQGLGEVGGARGRGRRKIQGEKRRDNKNMSEREQFKVASLLTLSHQSP